MQHLALRRLVDEFITRRFHQLGGVGDHFPLSGRRQRDAQQLFHPLQPVKRHAAAVLQLRDHSRGRFVIFLRPHARGLLSREDLPAGIAAQPLQFINGCGQRCLPHDPHQGLGLLPPVDLAVAAFRAAPAPSQLLMRDRHFARAAEGLHAVASVSR